MKAPQFSDAQKAFILKQGVDGVPVADICRTAGIKRPISTGRRSMPVTTLQAIDPADEDVGHLQIILVEHHHPAVSVDLSNKFAQMPKSQNGREAWVGTPNLLNGFNRAIEDALIDAKATSLGTISAENSGKTPTLTHHGR
jgi:hypothetical protein